MENIVGATEHRLEAYATLVFRTIERSLRTTLKVIAANPFWRRGGLQSATAVWEITPTCPSINVQTAGHSCLATIMLSLRDKNHPPIEAPRIRRRRLGTIVSEHPIVFVEEFGGSPSCPAQHRYILPTKRNDQTILAIVGVIKTTRGRLNPRQRKLVQLPSRPLLAHHRGHSCLTNLLFDVGPSSEGTRLSAKIAARVVLHFPPAAGARKAGLGLPISSDRRPPPISIDPRIGAIRCLNKRAPLLTLLPEGRALVRADRNSRVEIGVFALSHEEFCPARSSAWLY